MPIDRVRRSICATFLSLGLAAGVSGFAGTALAQDKPVLVFAAASLKGSLDAVAAQWQKETGKSVTISFAGSNVLIKQIEQGAPADIFASADEDWMDYGAKKNLIKLETRTDVLGGSLVLVAPSDSTDTVSLTPGVDLAGIVGDGKIATCQPSVPAGKYAKVAFEKLGIWDKVSPKLAQADNVRAALEFVARGEAKFGIVYATDAKAEPKVKVVATFPEDTHPPIVYPFAVTASSTNPDAATFLAYLRGPVGSKIFGDAGFVVKG